MNNKVKILCFLMLLVGFGLHRAFAAFIIEDGSKKAAKKYSLSTLHRPQSPFSLSSLGKKPVDLGGASLFSLPPVAPLPMNTVEVQSPVVLQNGHTLYIYNYKGQQQPRNPLPMFKTPSITDYRTK